jgi:ADP-ribose pyrophosphatase YjhB (NUDIX family)
MSTAAASRPLFNATPDRYGGIVCDMTGTKAAEPAVFATELFEFLQEETEKGTRGCWVKVKLPSQLPLFSALVAEGFTIHHAGPQPTSGDDSQYVMLNAWLPDRKGKGAAGFNSEDPSTLPAFCHTFVGVGAVVFRESAVAGGEPDVLVVRERYNPVGSVVGASASSTNNGGGVERWNLPGGLVNRCEPVHLAVQREVKEETGIDCQFDSLVYLRHAPTYQFGCTSDFYIVFRCKPLSFDTSGYDKKEIADCRWMPVGQFLALKDEPDASQPQRCAFKPFRDAVWRALLLDSEAKRNAAAGKASSAMVRTHDQIFFGVGPSKRRFSFDCYLPGGSLLEAICSDDDRHRGAGAAPTPAPAPRAAPFAPASHAEGDSQHYDSTTGSGYSPEALTAVLQGPPQAVQQHQVLQVDAVQQQQRHQEGSRKMMEIAKDAGLGMLIFVGGCACAFLGTGTLILVTSGLDDIKRNLHYLFR